MQGLCCTILAIASFLSSAQIPGAGGIACGLLQGLARLGFDVGTRCAPRQAQAAGPEQPDRSTDKDTRYGTSSPGLRWCLIGWQFQSDGRGGGGGGSRRIRHIILAWHFAVNSILIRKRKRLEWKVTIAPHCMEIREGIPMSQAN